MKKMLHIIPHSHWDREWYMPFEKHRVRLVDLFDSLIEVMEQNPDYTYYHMDGQYIVVEDYLEIRPHMRERLLKLIREDRIQIGPWYVLQDEFLTSGEANVRNMLYGIRLCREIGADPVGTGYFPDSFGNISQAPQIVKGFGFDNAAFGRGVNHVGYDNSILSQNHDIKSELIWRSPDGSEVIGIMFANWYNNATELSDDPEALKKQLAYIERSTTSFATTDHLLGMCGCDHQPLQKNLHEVIRLANKVQDSMTVKQSNFKDYLKEIRENQKDLRVYEGEITGQLTSGHGLLINTASSHIDIKQDNYNAQHLLERITEPLCTMAMVNGKEYPQDFLLYAWKKLMQNHPHDSICSCSCDEIYDEMKERFAKSVACTESLRDRALDFFAASVDTGAVDGERAIILFSLEPNEATVTVRANVDFDKDDDIEAITVCDAQGNEIPATYQLIRNQFTYTLPDDRFRQPKRVTRFVVDMQVKTHGIGRQVFSVKRQAPTKTTAIRYTERTLENDALLVHLNDNGTMDVTDKATGRVFVGQNLIEDVKDSGNLYNFHSVPGDVPVTNQNTTAAISIHEVTPFSVTLKAELSLEIDADVTTYVTLQSGVARVDIRTVVTNRAENHRLRALFDADIETSTVLSEGQFDVVRRNIHPAAKWTCPHNPQRTQAFVALESENGSQALMIANRGLCEYEILRNGRNTIAVTLLRCTGEIGDWGDFPTPKGQCKGTYTLEYSMIPYTTEARAQAYQCAYSFAAPAALAIGTDIHGGSLASTSQDIAFDNAYVHMTALKKTEDRDSAVIRFFNASEQEQPLTVTLGATFKNARQLTLGEETIAELCVKDGVLVMSIPAKKIVTVELF